ncbi:DEAD/DEAH box helicase [Hoyosella sp. YIM 151337]|uniref:DEAD/DEAH box helicase n=1 Tax=Hoyosella sp. YIM 151337 TaxID=2992742 RepID=UPI0035A961D9
MSGTLPSPSPREFGEDLIAALVSEEALGTCGAPAFTTVIPAREAAYADWPDWVHPPLRAELENCGIKRLYGHQAEAANLAHRRTSVVTATGTASGKSLVYQLPIVTALAESQSDTALYLAPTKALGADQLKNAARLTNSLPGLDTAHPYPYDGDTPSDIRPWIRNHARWVFTNPDMLHIGILPSHERWARFFRGLRYVVVDECHHYRGIFGSSVSWVIRRLRRIARRYGADPVFILASATTANPAAAATRLVGINCAEVTEDCSPHGARTVAMWEPGFLTSGPDHGSPAPARRSATTEAAALTASLVREGARTLTFVRSRAGAEFASMTARRLLDESGTGLAHRVTAYRAGYLAEDRRRIETDLAEGELLGVTTTNALELGVDIAGLDAVVIAGFPGTRASFWQQSGRAGRRGQGAVVILVARDDPLDSFLVHNPAALLGKPVEATVTDPGNPYVQGPHLLCAAAEHPLSDAEAAQLGVVDTLHLLEADGLIRHRPSGWFIAPGVNPHEEVSIRGGAAGQVAIVESATGALLGTVDAGRAPATVHPGAVHLHQGDTYLVENLNLEEGLALVRHEDPGWSTTSRSVSDIRITHIRVHSSHGAVSLGLADVEVTSQVVSYLRRLPTGEILDTVELEMPTSTLHTVAVMWTITPGHLTGAGIADDELPGALHAAEHAAIGLLPLVATADRGDIGGVSTALHADTGLPTVFIYDGHPGGAGIAERGHSAIREWLTATADVIERCGCVEGCPSCVQSPKCGNGNDPLDKAGAIRVLRAVLGELPQGPAFVSEPPQTAQPVPMP